MDIPTDRCRLLTDVFSRLLQLLLALVGISLLWIKRKLEFPIRPVKVWAMDVSKQSLGAFFVHACNVVTSILLVSSSSSSYDECGVYLITYVVDTTWGGFLTIVFLRAIDSVAARLGYLDVARCGDYGDPPQIRVWWEQFLAFLMAITFMKVFNLFVLWTFFPEIAGFATRLFSSFEHHRHLELSVVMLVVPGCCNAIQLWIVDSYIKSQSKEFRILSPTSFEREKQWIRQNAFGYVPPSKPSVGNDTVKSVTPL